jgi:hypothetical protein
MVKHIVLLRNLPVLKVVHWLRNKSSKTQLEINGKIHAHLVNMSTCQMSISMLYIFDRSNRSTWLENKLKVHMLKEQK